VFSRFKSNGKSFATDFMKAGYLV